MAITFEDYILGLTSGTITTGSDYIPYYDAGTGTVQRGTITTPNAWATFGTSLTGTSGSGATVSVTSARWTNHGYVVFVEIQATVTSKGTCAGDFTIIGPYTPGDVRICHLSGGVYASGGIVNRGLPYTESGLIKFISSAPSTLLNWSAISVGDLIFISGFYEI